MMELGATVCLPRAPRCSECPVRELCRTRGEHPTPARAPQRSQPVACLLDLRKRGPATEVLLERRPARASVMPAMVELPPLPLDAVEGLEPALRIRHTITNTNYYVQVFSPRRLVSASSGSLASTGKRSGVAAQALRSSIPMDSRDLHWTRTTQLAGLPLTGLTRKILQRLKLMEKHRAALPE
jgi:A/G-specific adenine glycosylase